MRFFKVLYDFQASDTVEITVKKGDLVCCPSDTHEQDGWLKVELASDTRRKGFVPSTYIKETTTNASTSAAAFLQQRTPQASLVNNRSGSGSAIVAVQETANLSGVGVMLSPGPAVVTPASVTEAFMKNDVYFKQLMKQRQESLAKLELGIGEAIADIAACKDKNATLARKLRDLDGTIEKERRKWAQRVEEEKALVQRSAQTGPVFVPPPPTGHSTGYDSRSGSQAGLQHQQYASAGDRYVTSTITTTTKTSKTQQQQQQNSAHSDVYSDSGSLRH